MAVNQLASVPGSLGTAREALGRSGGRRTCQGALKSIDTHTDRQTDSQDRQDKGLGKEGRTWESLLRCSRRLPQTHISDDRI